MKIVGCDLHARQQSVAMLDTDTGELIERKLEHEGGQLREFYAALQGPVVVGIEATGAMQWFVELLEELGIECQVGHPAKIRAADTRHQKHDRRDAQLLMQLMVERRFPQLWIPSSEQRDLRALLRDRHHWVRLRTQVQSAVQAIALNHGLRKGRTLWSANGREALTKLALSPYQEQRRNALLCLHDSMNQRIQELHRQVEAEAQRRPRARQLMTHPGVGPVTALATEVFLGDPQRFRSAKAVASYIGMIPCENSSGRRQRLGELSKEGNSLLRYLWCEAAMHAVKYDPELKRFYRRKLVQKGIGIARVGAARKLGIRLWIMLRDQIDYEEFCRRRRQEGESPCRGA
jgi:transposase